MPALPVLLPGQDVLRLRRSFPRSKPALQVNTSAKRKSTTTYCTSSVLTKQCHPLWFQTTVTLMVQGHSSTACLCTQPQADPELILHPLEFPVELRKHPLKCGHLPEERECFATLYNGPARRKCSAGGNQRKG